MRQIKLTKGFVALVDDEDYKALRRWSWCENGQGYAVRSIRINGKSRQIFMHRQVNNTPEGFYTDHINGDRLDNQRANLRTVTASINNHNRGGIIGVGHYPSLSKINPYKAQITINHKNYHLGLFATEEEAEVAYWSAKLAVDDITTPHSVSSV